MFFIRYQTYTIVFRLAFGWFECILCAMEVKRAPFEAFPRIFVRGNIVFKGEQRAYDSINRRFITHLNL